MNTDPHFEPTEISVFELLDKIRRRPSLFLGGRKSLHDLHAFLGGYTCALGGERKCLREYDKFHQFHDWVAERLGYAESTMGWCNMIAGKCESDEEAYAKFFELLEDFRDDLANQS